MKAFFDMSVILNLSFLSIVLILGVFLRAKIPFFQKYLVPACLIGGVLGFLIINITGFPGVKPELFGAFSYHFFTFSFVCLGLRGMSKVDKNKGDATKEMVRGSLWQAGIFYLSLSGQIIIATAIIYLLNLTTGSNYLESIGFLAALGFTSGPGQALTTGLLWEQYGHANMSQLALTFGGVGFIVAFLVGVPLVRWGLKRKLNTYPITGVDEEVRTGLMAKENRPAGMYQVTQSSNVDTLAFQIALVLISWALAYYSVEFIALRVSESIAGTMWGLFFLIAMLFGLGVRFVLVRLGYEHLIDGDSMTRLTGWMIEFLLLSTLIGVKFAIVREYLVPIIVVSLVLAVFTLCLVLYFGRRIENYSFERTVMMFGTCTGTIPTGLILLRMVDSDLKTTVSVEAGMWNLLAIVLVYANICVHGFVVYKWGMPLTLAVYVATIIGWIIVFKLLKLTGPKQF